MGEMEDFLNAPRTMESFIGEVEFVVNGKGNRPTDRFPWGSRAPGLSIYEGPLSEGSPREGPPPKLFQFFVDADGFPVVTTDGHLVHFDETWTHVAVVA